MSLEHRWSSRKEINLNVNLYYPPVGMINGTTQNISLEGMYVAVNGVDIPPQARLEVCFTAETRGKSIEHRLPAYVVHGGDSGIGLMLQHVGYREFDALRYMLNAA
ncbi:PilZ domain-containing protein [Pseudomonadota bacterium]